MKSIIQSEKECCFTHSTANLEKHHIFNGPNRKNSEKYGLTVYLTHNMHNEPPDGVHHNKDNREHLCRIGQEAFEAIHGHEEFMRILRENFL